MIGSALGGRGAEVLGDRKAGLTLPPSSSPQITPVAQERSVCYTSLFFPQPQPSPCPSSQGTGFYSRCLYFLPWILSLGGCAHPGSMDLATIAPLMSSAVSILAWSQS